MQIAGFMAPNAFSLNTFFGNVLGRGKVWGFDILGAIGVLLLIACAWQVFKGCTSPQGMGGHFVKAALSFFFGGFFVFNGIRGVQEISGSDSLRDLTGTLMLSPLFTLPVKDWKPLVHAKLHALVHKDRR